MVLRFVPYPVRASECQGCCVCSYRIVARRRAVKALRLKRIQLPQTPEFVPEVEANPSAIHSPRLRQRLDRLGTVRRSAHKETRRKKATVERTIPTKPPLFPRLPKILTTDKLRKRRKTARST